MLNGEEGSIRVDAANVGLNVLHLKDEVKALDVRLRLVENHVSLIMKQMASKGGAYN